MTVFFFFPSLSLCLLQNKGNSSSAFSPYAINTVQVGNQEKYLIVSSFHSDLNADPLPLTLTKTWGLHSSLPRAAQWGGCGGGVPEDIRRFLWCCLSHVRHQWSSFLRLLCQYIQGQPQQKLQEHFNDDTSVHLCFFLCYCLCLCLHTVGPVNNKVSQIILFPFAVSTTCFCYFKINF